MATLTTPGAPDEYRLPTNVKPAHYDVTIKTDLENLSFEGFVRIELDVKEPTSRIVLNTSGLDLGQATLYSDSLKKELAPSEQTLDTASERVAYSVNDTLPAGSKAFLKVSFKGELTGSMMGYYKSTYEEDGKPKYYALTQFEPTAARRAFPCWDEPLLKATFGITLISRADTTNLSNMPAISEEAVTPNTDFGGDASLFSGLKDGQWKVTKFQTTPPMSSYIVIRLFVRHVRTQPQDEQYQQPEFSFVEADLPAYGLATPRELVRYLNQFVVGQENAKKVLSVAVYNHYSRVRANISILEEDKLERDVEPDGSLDLSNGITSARVRPMRRLTGATFQPTQRIPLFEKSNVLVVGPTGSGKTLLAKTLARILDVPFSVSDATSFTQAGYVGEDVDMAIQRLLQAANWDPVRASMGIVYIDEVDKIARKSSGVGTDTSRDVGGEGVQQALLRMMEGSIVSVQSKGAAAEVSPPGTHPRSGHRAPHIATTKSDVYSIDTSNVLFILSGAFVGLEDIIKQRVAKGSIGFTANLGAQSFELPRQLPFFTSNRKVSTGVLDHLESSDLIKFGFIPEFISRLPSITTLAPLTVSDLRCILMDVKGSLMSQYQALFGYSGVELRFTNAAVDEICAKAAARGGGARGLRGIMETLLLEPMYEVPGSDICHVLITEDVVKGTASAGYWKKGQGVAFWEAWAAEENKKGKK